MEILQTDLRVQRVENGVLLMEKFSYGALHWASVHVKKLNFILLSSHSLGLSQNWSFGGSSACHLKEKVQRRLTKPRLECTFKLVEFIFHDQGTGTLQWIKSLRTVFTRQKVPGFSRWFMFHPRELYVDVNGCQVRGIGVKHQPCRTIELS